MATPNPGKPANRDLAVPANGDVPDPDDWVTGDEPMTRSQAAYLHTLAKEAHEEPPPDDLTKAAASMRIDELQAETGRG
jgi:Protein of unknown function (DUF3072)